MAKHHPRFFTKMWLVMGAAAGLMLAISTPAHAETINLICNHWNSPTYISVDPDLQSVVYIIDNERYGPFAASISDALIRWTERPGTEREIQYTIDRVAGTIRNIHFSLGKQDGDYRGQCRRATQKF